MNAADTQAIYLIERYTSPSYFEALLTIWREFVALNEKSLDRYMHNLPADARTRPLPYQADVTWGGTVLPNIRSTLQALEDGYRMIMAGDLNGLSAAAGPVSDNRGIVDFSTDWLTKDEMLEFDTLLGKAFTLAFNIDRTEGAYWSPGALSYNYNEGLRGALNLPARLPRYSIINEPGVRSGYRVPAAGIYIPDVPHSSPQFLHTRFEAPMAEVLHNYKDVLHPVDGSIIGKEAVTGEIECTWRRVVRLTDAIETEPEAANKDWARIEAGERCRETGFYFSPALMGSRRKFSCGDLMPDLGTDFGRTIWQWDQKQ